MAAPDPIAALLAVEGSASALALRWGLHGLCASLRAATAHDPCDPGAAACADLLHVLDGLLGRPAAAAFVPAAAAKADAPLAPLRTAFLADDRVRRFVGECPPPDDPAGRWLQVQRLLLRLPPDLAREWADRALAAARSVGAVADEAGVVLPLAPDGVVCPGLSGSVHAPGLRTRADEPPDPRVGAPPPGDLGLLARVVDALLRLMDWDPDLYHALKVVHAFGLQPLREARSAYADALLDRLRRVRAAAEPPAALRARLDLDEAIHSVFHQPLAAEGSWWGRLRQTARQTLQRAADACRSAGAPVVLTEPSGPYADACRWTEKDVEVDDGGAPGEVASCLRLYAKIDGTAYPGRVLFRPARRRT